MVSSVNFRETIKLGCESLLSQEEIRFIERSQVTIQNFTCGSLFRFESCSLFLDFKHQEITTAKLKVLKRSNFLIYDSMTNSNYLTNSFFKKIVPFWNNFPPELKTKNGLMILSKLNSKTFSKTSLNNKLTHQNLTRNVGRTTGFFDFILNYNSLFQCKLLYNF